MLRKLFYLVSCVVLLSISFPAKAELVITNGDFEADAGAGDLENVSLWYDDLSTNFWESAWQSDRGGVTPNGTQVVVFCSWNTVEGDPLTGSYIYQSIGTSSGESSVTIGFDWGHPDDVAADRNDGLTVSVLASDGSFVADDANDVLGADGVTLLDSASYSHVAEGTDGEIFPVVVTLDLSGANAGDEIFLRFNNYLPEAGADPWPVLDNVQITDMAIGFGTPVIDGEVDDVWADAAAADFAALEDPANGSGIWKVLYDAENLYVLVDVTDDSLQNDSADSWLDDSVEIYFDGGNTKLDTPLSGDDHQYTFGWTTDEIQGNNIDGYTEGIEHAQATTEAGWRIEVKMPWMSIWGVMPQAGDLIGIDCYYNDDDDGGDSREGKMLSFSAVEGWNDASQWGTAMLTVAEGTTFLFDDFETYVADALLAALGWTILDTPEAIEASTWTITNPAGRANPPTLDGSASTGKFLISDSDQQTESNPVDSGASHDISTPSFSTLGSTTVWLHADVSAQLNNNGAAIFDVEVSTDGGGTWANVFNRVAPGRVSAEGATTRLPDNTNTGGYFGRLDVDLSGVAANQADVQVRFRHFEPNWDWWIAIDNVLIDNVAPPQGGPVTVFSEDFSNGLGQMNVVSGQGNTGTETWHTTDKGGRYVPGTVGEQGVNRLGPHPNEHPEFAIIDSDADPDPNEDEWLMTPSLDLSGLAEVFLHYESETVMSDGVWNQEVLVSLDGGSTFEATPIFAYTGGGLFDGGEEPAFAERIFDVSDIARGETQVVFAFRFTGDGDDWWWAIDNVKVSGSPLPEPVNPGTDGLVAFYALDGDANDISGNGIDGTIYNADTGGLGDGGSVWVDDPERGTVISFNGTAAGAYVRAGEIPQMTLTNDFTWSFWANHSDENTADNDIILGNRMDENAVDFVPRQFIKFTPTKFEWHMNGNGDDNLDYDDIPADIWLHHAVVKTGDQLTYYRNGIEASSGTFTQPLDFPQPLFFGGDNEGAEGENWSGLMSEVGIYNRALSGGEVRYLAGERPLVSVENFSFELPGTEKIKGWNGEGVADTPAVDIPGWSSDTVVVDSGVETGFAPTDGEWTAFLMSGDPSVWQLTDHTIGEGNVLELKVDARNTWAATAMQMTLYYDDSGVRVPAATNEVTLTDDMQEYTLSLSAADVPESVGKKIGIEFSNASSGDSWIGLDNVRLVLVSE